MTITKEEGPVGIQALAGSPPRDASSPKKRHGHGAADAAEGPIETVTYRDPFAGVYKKCVCLGAALCRLW